MFAWWVTASGRATLYSYVISHRPAPGFADDAPYAIAVVELEEGPRMMTNLVHVEATPENVANFTYPLARAVKFYINRGPEIPADPNVVEFLRFILSREGQALVAREGDFLPLTAAVAREQLKALE